MHANRVKADRVEFISWDTKRNFHFNELRGGVADDAFKPDNDFTYFLVCMSLAYSKKSEEFYNPTLS